MSRMPCLLPQHSHRAWLLHPVSVSIWTPGPDLGTVSFEGPEHQRLHKNANKVLRDQVVLCRISMC